MNCHCVPERKQMIGGTAMNTEWMEKRRSTEALILQAERQLREVALDFGMQFARRHRLRIGNICQELLSSLQQNDDLGIDLTVADLQDALYDLNREMRAYYAEDDEDDLLGTIRDLFTSNDEDDNTGDSPPIPSPRRPGPKPPNNDEAVLPPIDY